jgi:hypothetical protein
MLPQPTGPVRKVKVYPPFGGGFAWKFAVRVPLPETWSEVVALPDVPRVRPPVTLHDKKPYPEHATAAIA